MFNVCCLPARPRRSLRRSSIPLRVELLEDRLVPALIVVHHHSDGASTPFVGHLAPNLRSAIDHSNSGDVIELDSAIYTLRSELDVGHNLLIQNGGGGFTTISGQGQTRVFEIDNLATATLKGLIIEGGNGNGSGEGGGILVGLGSTLTLNSDRVLFNKLVAGRPAQGGGIYNAGTLTAINTSISQNFISGQLNSAISGIVMGGGIYSSGQLTLSNCVVSGNSAVAGSVFPAGGSEQGVPAFGGGLFLAATAGSVSAVITDTSFLQNRALGGFAGGPAAGGGLDQDASSGSVTITGCTFYQNTAAGGASFGGQGTGAGNAFGGGLYQTPGAGGLSIFNSTFANNKAVGGLVALPGATAGSATAGGLYLGGSAFDFLVNDTIARNSAGPASSGGSGRAGGLYSFTLPTLWNTLIALNSATLDPDVNGQFADAGHNLVGNTTGSVGFSAARHDLLNLTPAQIGLGNLANNGGPTETISLEPFSIAIDHGDNSVLSLLKTDQRGLPRLSGAAVDIGAFELQFVPFGHGGSNGPQSD
jgi:hypothetical protein